MHHMPDEILYDVRLVERHITKGFLTRDQVAKHLEKLEDLTAQAETLNADGTARVANGLDTSEDDEEEVAAEEAESEE